MDELAEKLKQAGVIRRWMSGIKKGHLTDYYIDIKLAYGHPDILNEICDRLWEHMDKSTTCAAASGYGGMVPAAVLSTRHKLRLTMIRERREYLTGDIMQGYTPSKNDRVSILDDVFTRNQSPVKRVETIKSTGAEIVGYYVVVKRDEPNIGVPFDCLFIARDLL